MKKFAFYISFVSILAACSTLAPPPTPTPIPSPSHKPTSTATASATSTETPTLTPTATITPTLTKTPTSKPTDTPTPPPISADTAEPVQAYKGIPIMPGAISGQEEAGEYAFTISATIEQVKSYYSEELTKMGKMCVLNAFESTSTSDGLMCIAGGPMVIVLIDMLEDGRLQVMILVE